MANDTKKCWYCGKLTMKPAPELGWGWYRCSNCLAGHFPNPVTLGVETLVVDKEASSRWDTRYRPRKRRLPKTPART